MITTIYIPSHEHTNEDDFENGVNLELERIDDGDSPIEISIQDDGGKKLISFYIDAKELLRAAEKLNK